jgi:hypothetical protein
LPTRAAKSADKLRLAAARHLRLQDAYFDFLVQLQTDAETIPIEDASFAWDEQTPPFRKVATLRIPRQTFDSPSQNDEETMWPGNSTVEQTPSPDA